MPSVPITTNVLSSNTIGARCTTLCDKVCHWLVTGRWFSPDTPVSSINKTDCHDMTEILLKVVLNTINQTRIFWLDHYWWSYYLFWLSEGIHLFFCQKQPSSLIRMIMSVIFDSLVSINKFNVTIKKNMQKKPKTNVH